MIGAFILRNPPVGWKPPGWVPAAATAKVMASRHEFTPGEVVKTPAFYFMWIAYALGTGAGLMLISQLVPFGRQQLNIVDVAANLAIAVGAVGNASGRIFSGWLSDTIGRLFDIFGNYTNAFYVGSGICILALGSLLLAKRPEVSAMAGVEAVKGAKAA